MINLKIDLEFQSQIPPLTDDEFKQLEENILKEGKLISPLIVWNNTLVNGHNRYEIVQEHPEISFSTMPLPFESREEVLAVAEPALNQMAKYVADKIKELNGDKPVSAVFVVGGGGKLAGYTEKLAEYLGIAKERVAVRGEH